jgi:hypothetical protein
MTETWEQMFGDEVEEYPAFDMKIGVLGTPRYKKTGPSSIYKPYTEQLLKIIADKENAEIVWSKSREVLEECDVIFVPEFFNQDMYAFFEEDRPFSKPTIHYIVNSRRPLNKGMRAADRLCQAIWNSANYLEDFESPAFWVPCSTYPIKHRSPDLTKEILDRDEVNRVIMQSRHHKDKHRLNALQQFLNKWSGDPIDFTTRDKDVDLQKVGLLNHPLLNHISTKEMEGYENYQVIIECESKQQLKQKEYWSDRQPIAVSHGCFVVTNFEETLNNWESTISHEDYLSGNYTLDVDKLKRDMEKWSMVNTVLPVWEKTKEALGL